MFNIKLKSFFLAIWTLKIRNRIMRITRGHMDVGDDIAAAINGTMVEIEKSFGLLSRTI